jgi:hypothetical protein
LNWLRGVTRGQFGYNSDQAGRLPGLFALAGAYQRVEKGGQVRRGSSILRGF